MDRYNLNAWIGCLRKGTLYRELNGETITRKTMLKALASLNDKAVAFHKAHFAEKIVQIHACDFRQDPMKDQSARVGVCKDPILSLRNVGQRFLALALDMDKLPVLTRVEFRNIVTGLAVFYKLDAVETEGPAAKRQKVVFNTEIELVRATHEMQKASLAEK